MSAGMAEVIAAHRYSFNRMGCVCGGWDQAESAPSHAAHVAEELSKAGFGDVHEALLSAADEMEQERSTWCLDDSGRHWIRRTLSELRERAHALDPEGHALVKAIHDRKAEA